MVWVGLAEPRPRRLKLAKLTALAQGASTKGDVLRLNLP